VVLAPLTPDVAVEPMPLVVEAPVSPLVCPVVCPEPPEALEL